jgi:hypothetical protein
MKLPTFAQIRKSAVYVLSVAGLLLSAGLLHGTAEAVVSALVAAAGGLGVYGVRNAPWGGPAPLPAPAPHVPGHLA